MDGDRCDQKKNRNLVLNGSIILQSIWIRYNSVLVSILDRKFMERQLCFVLCSGSVFWIIHILSILL